MSISCSTQSSKKLVGDKSSQTTYEITSLNGKQLEIIDYPCSIAKTKAREDFQNGIQCYFDPNHFDPYRSNKELAEILKKFGIDVFENFGIGSNQDEYNCYEELMNQNITKKYGSNFIDSLRTIAEIQFVRNNPDKIYSFEECDTISRHPKAKTYKEYFNKYKEDYFQNFEYPLSYNYKQEEYYSYTSAKFILNKDSSVKITFIETTFQNPENEIHTKLFNDRVTDFILKTKWIPAKSAGIVVASIVPITLHYK
jgi:hypothetical protein